MFVIKHIMKVNGGKKDKQDIWCNIFNIHGAPTVRRH